MGRGKIVYFGEVLMDLTADTVVANKVLKDVTFHGKDGEAGVGTCTFDSDTTDATAAVAEVLDSKTFYARGAKQTGTMPNRGSVKGTITTKDGSYTIAQGYHDGSGTVKLDATAISGLVPENIRENVTVLGIKGVMSGSEDENAQESITVTPGKTQQTITPGEGYTCLRQVIVSAIPYVESENAAGGITVTIG